MIAEDDPRYTTVKKAEGDLPPNPTPEDIRIDHMRDVVLIEAGYEFDDEDGVERYQTPFGLLSLEEAYAEALKDRLAAP